MEKERGAHYWWSMGFLDYLFGSTSVVYSRASTRRLLLWIPSRQTLSVVMMNAGVVVDWLALAFNNNFFGYNPIGDILRMMNALIRDGMMQPIDDPAPRERPSFTLHEKLARLIFHPTAEFHVMCQT